MRVRPKASRPVSYRWSPDSKQIVYDGFAPPNDAGEKFPAIFVADAFGGGSRLLHSNGCQAIDVPCFKTQLQAPDWSPDGSRLAVVSRRTTYREDGSGGFEVDETFEGVGLLDPVTGANRILFEARVPQASQSGTEVAWAPNGRTIAYLPPPPLGPESLYQILLIDVAAGTARVVRDRLRGPHQLTWSADGKWLGYRAGAGDQFTYRLGGGAPRRFTYPLAWSPRGARTAFYQSAGGFSRGSPDGIFVARADGSRPKLVTRLRGFYEVQDWSQR